MTDPRATNELEGILYKAATFDIDNSTITYEATEENGSSVVGRAVTLSSDQQVALAADAEAILGKLISVSQDNKCVVQLGGFMTLPGGTSATLTLGAKVVGDLLVAAKGYIRVSDGSTAAEIIKQRGIIVDNDDTTAVLVYLP